MKTIIGVIGPIASGKDTVSEYLEKKLNCQSFQISGPLKEEARKRGLETTRSNLIDLAKSLGREKGQAYLAEVLLVKIKKLGVISGMRQLGQIEFLRKNTRFILIAVDADEKLRFSRATARSKLGEGQTYEEFLDHERRDGGGGGGVQNLSACMAMADYLVENNSSLEHLFKQVDQILSKEKVSNETPDFKLSKGL